MGNNVFIKPRDALTGANAAAWENDTTAWKLTSNVRTVDLVFAGFVNSIRLGSAGAE